jgi:hypothetical protein
MQQQEKKQNMGLEDPRGLFQFSRTCSKQSRQNALRLGNAPAKSFQERRQTTLDAIDDVLALLSEPYSQ